MFSCKRCGKNFRDNYILNRHLSKMKPCEDKNKKPDMIHQEQNEQNTSFGLQKEPLSSQKEPLSSQKEPLSSQKEPLDKNKCGYCLYSFCNNYSLRRHQENCKSKDDPVRLLEIEKGIEPCLAASKTECRFCNKLFFNTSKLNKHNLNCKDRKKYHDELLNKPTRKSTIGNNINVNNNYINNGTINNSITINLLGNEDTSHIDIYKIIENLRKLNNEYGNEHIYLQAGEMVINYDEILREVPENKNLYLPDDRSIYAEVKIEDGWKKMERENVLNTSFKNSAKKLYESQESINSVNEKVFKTKSIQNVFKEVGEFSKKGFKHNSASSVVEEYNQEDKKKIYKQFKINQLKKKNVPNF
jgi:hypothetical protein